MNQTQVLHHATRCDMIGEQLHLGDKKKLFFQIRTKCEIVVTSHAYRDYPERGFSKNELVNLVRMSFGRVVENKSADAIDDSFLFYVKDDLNRECKLVLLIKDVEIFDDETNAAFREIERRS